MPTTADLLAQMERWLPNHYRSLRPVTAGRAASAELASDAIDGLVGSVSIEGAEDIFLSLLARGYGVNRAMDESDESLRYRLRNVERKITRPAILERVDAILAEFSAEPAEMFEHFESGAFCDQDYCEQSTIYDWHNAFTLVVPRIGDDDRVSDYCDIGFCGDSYAGPAHTHPAYITILAEVHRIRAAGIRWWLKVAEEEDFRVSIVETVHFGHLPSDVQVWPVWVPEGFRLTVLGHRSSVSPTDGDISIEMDDDGTALDVLEATPIDITGDTIDTDVDDTAALAVDTNTRTTPTGGAYFNVIGTDIDLGAVTENVAVHLTFTPVN